MMTPKERDKYDKAKMRAEKKLLAAAESGLDKSGSIHNSQEDVPSPNAGGQSLGRFKDSQSGH